MVVKSNLSKVIKSSQPNSTVVTQEKKFHEKKSLEVMSSQIIERAKLNVKDTKKSPKEELETQIETINKMMEVKNTGLKFNIHDELDRIFVQVIDRNTDEVIKEIPSKKFLDMITTMLDFMGLLIDERV